MRRSVVVIPFVLLAITLVGVSHAITGGELDGNAHPNVAMIVFYNPDGRFRCSATLVSPTVLVTAAHCTDGVLGKVIATFEPVAPPSPPAADDPGDGTSKTGYTAQPADWLIGTPHTHPLWQGRFGLKDLHDVGVIVLDEPFTGAAPAPLAPLNYLAGLADGNGGFNKEVFTVVGYGIFFEKPAEGLQRPTAVSDRARRFVNAVGQNISSQALKLAENPNDSRAEGGSCFADSGGPALHGGLVVGHSSFGPTQFCQGADVYYRLDTDDARSFLDDYVTVP
jgi:Trypsin